MQYKHVVESPLVDLASFRTDVLYTAAQVVEFSSWLVDVALNELEAEIERASLIHRH